MNSIHALSARIGMLLALSAVGLLGAASGCAAHTDLEEESDGEVGSAADEIVTGDGCEVTITDVKLHQPGECPEVTPVSTPKECASRGCDVKWTAVACMDVSWLDHEEHSWAEYGACKRGRCPPKMVFQSRGAGFFPTRLGVPDIPFEQYVGGTDPFSGTCPSSNDAAGMDPAGRMIDACIRYCTNEGADDGCLGALKERCVPEATNKYFLLGLCTCTQK